MRFMRFDIEGDPAPQGSKSAFAVRDKTGKATGKIVVTEQNKKTKPWRSLVAGEVRATKPLAFTGPVRVTIMFYLNRPASVTAKRRPFPAVKPDLDKLTRAVLDALKMGGAYTDDGLVCELSVMKRYADFRKPGAVIIVSELNATDPIGGTQ